MITPADIENKIFGKGVRGYKEDEVDSFLNEIIYDMEALIRENNQLKTKIEKMKQQKEQQVSTERSVLETLEAAKGLMNDIAASAERRAEILVKDAQLEAEVIKKEARESVDRLTEEGAELQRRVNLLKGRYKEMLEEELNRLASPRTDLLAEFEKDFLPKASLEMTAEIKKDKIVKEDIILADRKNVKEDNKVDLSKTVMNIRY